MSQDIEIPSSIRRKIHILPQVVYIFATNFKEITVSSEDYLQKIKFGMYNKAFLGSEPWLTVRLDSHQYVGPGISDIIHQVVQEFKLLRRLRELRGDVNEIY